MRPPLWIVVVTTAALGAASCSAASSDESLSAASSLTTSTSEAAPTSAPSTAPPSTAPPSTGAVPTARPERAANVETYCALSAAADALVDGSVDLTDPAETEVVFTQFAALAEQGRQVVPDEIEADFNTMADAWLDLVYFLEISDWDYRAGLEAADSLLSSTEVEAAGAAVDAYDEANCADAGGDDDAAGAAPLLDPDEAEAMLAVLDTELGREAFIEGFLANTSLSYEQGECFLDTAPIEALITMSSDDASASDMAEFFDALETCDIPLSALNPLSTSS